MRTENINELMEAPDVTAANKALDEGWTLISVVSRADEALYVLGRHKETAKDLAIRKINAERAAVKAKADQGLWNK